MAVTPTGILSLPMARLANLVADSETFRALVDADDREEALPSIFYGVAETDPDTPYTRAIIRFLDDAEFEQVANTLAAGLGALVLTFELEKPDDAGEGDSFETKGDEYIWFCNQLGAIVAEMKQLWITADEDKGLLFIQRMSMGSLGWIDPKENNGHHVFGCEWFVYFPQRL